MILLGILLILEMYVFCWILGLPNRILFFAQIHFDLLSLLFVILGVFGYIVLRGKEPFFRGMSALIRLPKQGDAEVADYFWKLSWFTLFWGVSGMTLSAIWALLILPQPDIIGQAMATSILTFTYAAWPAMILFLPISLRFSIKPVDMPTVQKRFPVGGTLLSIAAFFLTRALMAILLVTMMHDWTNHPEIAQPGEMLMVAEQTFLTFNPGDPTDEMRGYLNPFMYWDTPSLLIVLLGIWAFRIAAGPIRNRMIWVPVCIVTGLLWSLEGFTLMLSDLDPDKLSPGCLVALLTALYGLFAAFCVIVRIERFVFAFFNGLILLFTAILIPMAIFYACTQWQEVDSRDLIFVPVLFCTILSLGVPSSYFTVEYFRQRRKKNRQETESAPDEQEAQRILDEAVNEVKKRSELTDS